MPSTLGRLWLPLAQVVTIGAGMLIAWRAFGPTAPSPHNDLVAIREPASSSSLANAILGRRTDAGFRTAAHKASASVVNVYTRTGPRHRKRGARSFGEDARASLSLGSGVIVAAQGYILTNNHVVEGATEIAVVLPGGKVADARVLGADPRRRSRRAEGGGHGSTADHLRRPALGASGRRGACRRRPVRRRANRDARHRERDRAQPTWHQHLRELHPTDAAINPGNSGGALVDIDGNLIGINAAIYSESGGSQGIGFAIPVSLARQVMEQIIAHGRVERGWIGVVARDAERGDAGATGAVIERVQRGGPAEKAGLRVGDTVTAMNGKGVADATALINETAMLAPGTRVEFKLVRPWPGRVLGG